jgi:hypothetical protein
MRDYKSVPVIPLSSSASHPFGGIIVAAMSVSLLLTALVGDVHSAGLILEREPPRSTSAYNVVPFTTEGARAGSKSYFTDKTGKILIIDSDLIVEIVGFPELQNITDQSSLPPLRAKKAELEAVAAKVPSTKPYIAPQIAAIENQIARFQFGERMINGKWLTGPEYQKFQADAAAAQAATKAQEEKRIAEQKAAEEKRRAEEKALDDKRIEEQKAAERERMEREKNAEAELKQSIEQFQAAEQRGTQNYQKTIKGTLSGQVFVATNGRENFKLGAVRISLFARDAIDILLAGLKRYADVKIQQLSPSLDAAKTASEQALYAERAAFNTYLKSHYADGDYATLKQAYREAGEGANRARGEHLRILADVSLFYSGAFYFPYLLSPIQTAETDAEGKFAIEVPLTGAFVIAAQAKRMIWEQTERYYWLQPVSLEGQQQRVQNLSNNNLTSATGTSSLILTRD